MVSAIGTAITDVFGIVSIVTILVQILKKDETPIVKELGLSIDFDKV